MAGLPSNELPFHFFWLDSEWYYNLLRLSRINLVIQGMHFGFFFFSKTSFSSFDSFLQRKPTQKVVFSGKFIAITKAVGFSALAFSIPRLCNWLIQVYWHVVAMAFSFWSWFLERPFLYWTTLYFTSNRKYALDNFSLVRWYNQSNWPWEWSLARLGGCWKSNFSLEMSFSGLCL